MRHNGTVAEIKQSSKTEKWSAKIQCAAFDYNLHYPMCTGEENTLVQGMQVTFETQQDTSNANKKSACRLQQVADGQNTQAGNTGRQRDIQPGRNAGRPGNSQAGNANRRDNRTMPEQTVYYLPKDTSELLFGSSPVSVDNTALRTQKYIKQFCSREKNLKILHSQKYSQAEESLLAEIVKAQLDILSAYRHTHCISAALGSRMMVGLGTESVFETGITLHHTYGFPYIPGSALKGCLRSFIIRDAFDGNEEAAQGDDDFTKIFGTQESMGQVLFLDAYPTQCGRLELDIMNPHYTDYYQGKSAPTDDQKPMPIKFYAVPKGTEFTFRLASRKLKIKQAQVKSIDLTKMLTDALHEIGIGAKTAVGYGWFGQIKEVKA